MGFFGLTNESVPIYRRQIFEQIHSIVFHSKGGYDWSTTYNMPIWLRRFTVLELTKNLSPPDNKERPDENTLVTADGKVNVPTFLQGKSSYN